MAIDPQSLARATASWLEFELRCDREELFSEAYLAHPIGQVLNATTTDGVSTEEPHPLPAMNTPGRRGAKKCLDFAVFRRGSTVLTDVIETKFATAKGPSNQEIADDLCRLELVNQPGQQPARYFLVAGRYANVLDSVINAQVNIGGGRAAVFGTVLPSAVGTELTVEVDGSTGSLRELWKRFYNELGIAWPARFKVSLAANWPPAPDRGDMCCYVWEVGRQQNRIESPAPIP